MMSKRVSAFFIAGIVVVLSVVFSGFVLFDGDPVILKIITQLGIWVNDHPIEKTYLQLDKPYYAAGDDIWLKAYITVGSQHRLSALSGAVNVELIDENDSVKKWIKLPVVNGTAWGDIELPDTLRAGSYRIRAYTNWMRNAGPGYYFDKVINIGNTVADAVVTRTNYTYGLVKDEQKVTATITFTNTNGVVYAGKPVTYRVQFNDKVLARGKGITNDKGEIMIDPIAVQASKGSIITDIKLSDNNTVTKTVTINATSGQVDVQFFPESGHLVNGLHSKVAFKAVGPNGLGVNVKGVLTDDQNNKLAEFNAQHLGMGYFNFTPQSGRTYKALLTYADGTEHTLNLPQALNTGYVLSVSDADDNNISLNVKGTADLAGAGNIYVFAQCGSDARYVGQSQASGIDFNATVAKSRFPAGIVQFTLFSAKGEPLNERVAFIAHPDSLLNLDISSARPVTAPREKVRIELNAQNCGKPIIGNFSATVIDGTKVQSEEADETTILSHILLTSDLRGYIEQPNYYFNKSNAATRADLDVLMLTQGYRRFEWKPVLAGTTAPAVHQPEKLINIAGSVKTLTGKPVANAKVTAITTAASGQFILDTVANKQGEFTFKDLLLKDSTRFVIKAYTPGGGKNVVIKMNSDEDVFVNNKDLWTVDPNANYELLGAYLKADKKLYDEELRYGLRDHHAIALKEVTIKTQKKPGLEHSSNLNGPGNADQVVSSDDLEKRGCLSLDDCLNGMLTGVVFREGIPHSSRVTVIAGGNSDPKAGSMLIILDGVPQDHALEPNFLGTIPVHDVASIEVLRTGGATAIYGSRGANGVLIINTKRGDEKDLTPVANEPGMLIYTAKGYYRAREFYSPQYDDPKTNASVADLRTTIYWKPNIITDRAGHAFFEYYNAGSPGSYQVIIEGIDGEGHLGRGVYQYKVE